MSILDAALEWAEAGVPVFPVGANKAPLTTNGHKDASTDPEKVKELFAGNPWGIGAAMGRESGLFAVDSDHYKEGAAGEAATNFINDLDAEGLLPETRTHTTQSGGRHYLFASDTDWPNCKPSGGVEVKGEGGYIVVPPSPGYGVEREGIADAPRGLITLLNEKKAASSMTPSNALKAQIMAGEDFHDSLTLLAARRAAEGASPEKVQSDLLEVLNASVAASERHPRHSRWKSLVEDRSKELSRIVFSAESKFNPDAATAALREAAGGCFGTPAPQAPPIFKTAPKTKTYSTDEWPFGDVRGYFGHTALDDVLDQNFVAYPILVEGEVTLISAEPKAGKTLVSQTLAMHIAAGIDLGEIKIYERRPVLYFALESQVAIKKRLKAWRSAHDPDNTMLTDATFPFFVSEMPLNLMQPEVRKDVAQRVAASDVWFQKEGAAPLGLIVIDTLTKAMPGGDQNSVEDTSQVFEIIREIRALGVRAPIMIIHHNRKDGGSPRGSGNIQAEPDTLLTLSRNADTSQLHLKIYMARSIEDDHDFIFDIKTVNLGKSQQGYEIDAPILTAALVERNTIDSVVDDLKLEMAYAEFYKRLVEFGPGEHPIKRIHKELKKDMPEKLYGKVKGLWSSSPEYLDFFTELVPNTGKNFDGHNLQPVVKKDAHGHYKLDSLVIRPLTRHA